MTDTNGITITPAVPKPKRPSVPVQSTYSRNNADLDFPSHMAVKWIDKWIAEQGGPKFPASAIIRRALALYVGHLEATQAHDAKSAIKAVKGVCCTFRPSVEMMDAADRRLREPGVPLRPFKVVLHGQRKVNQDKAFMLHLADVEARIDAGTYK